MTHHNTCKIDGNTSYNAAVLIDGKKVHKNKDWIEDNISTLEVMNATRRALIKFKRSYSQQNLRDLKAVRIK